MLPSTPRVAASLFWVVVLGLLLPASGMADPKMPPARAPITFFYQTITDVIRNPVDFPAVQARITADVAKIDAEVAGKGIAEQTIAAVAKILAVLNTVIKESPKLSVLFDGAQGWVAMRFSPRAGPATVGFGPFLFKIDRVQIPADLAAFEHTMAGGRGLSNGQRGLLAGMKILLGDLAAKRHSYSCRKQYNVILTDATSILARRDREYAQDDDAKVGVAVREFWSKAVPCMDQTFWPMSLGETVQIFSSAFTNAQNPEDDAVKTTLHEFAHATDATLPWGVLSMNIGINVQPVIEDLRQRAPGSANLLDFPGLLAKILIVGEVWNNVQRRGVFTMYGRDMAHSVDELTNPASAFLEGWAEFCEYEKPEAANCEAELANFTVVRQDGVADVAPSAVTPPSALFSVENCDRLVLLKLAQDPDVGTDMLFETFAATNEPFLNRANPKPNTVSKPAKPGLKALCKFFLARLFRRNNVLLPAANMMFVDDIWYFLQRLVQKHPNTVEKVVDAVRWASLQKMSGDEVRRKLGLTTASVQGAESQPSTRSAGGTTPSSADPLDH